MGLILNYLGNKVLTASSPFDFGKQLFHLLYFVCKLYLAESLFSFSKIPYDYYLIIDSS